MNLGANLSAWSRRAAGLAFVLGASLAAAPALAATCADVNSFPSQSFTKADFPGGLGVHSMGTFDAAAGDHVTYQFTSLDFPADDGDDVGDNRIYFNSGHGLAWFSPNGTTTTHTSVAAFDEFDGVDLTVDDAHAYESADFSFNVSVSCAANQLPVASPDSYETDRDTPLQVLISNGPLLNDSDADGETLKLDVDGPGSTQPAHGTVSTNEFGAFLYTPDPGFFGEDSFKYVATDGFGDSEPATVTITVHQTFGSVTIRQVTIGGDGTFRYASTIPDLTFTIDGQAGVNVDHPVGQLPSGSYFTTQRDATDDGFTLNSITCNDDDSTGDLDTGKLTINLDAGESLICIFTNTDTRGQTTAMIDDFFATRAAIILDNEGDISEHIDKLNNFDGSIGGDQVSALMGLMPIVHGDSGSIDLSLGAIDRATGRRQPQPVDLWLKGSYGAFDKGSATGRYGLATAGIDYTVSSDLLLGGFVQLDSVSQDDDPGSISGLGFLAGPYATMRLTENMFLDLKAGAGTATNEISPDGTYTDSFDSVRWLLSATLQGSWSSGAWTFEPVARLSYFQESSHDYTDSLGVYIPSVTTGLGQFALGPKVSYRFTVDGDVVIDTGLKLEAVADFGRSDDGGLEIDGSHAALEASVGVTTAAGLHVGASLGYTGPDSDDLRTLTGKLSVRASLD